MMPSGVPPMPTSRSAPDRAARGDGAGDVAVGDQADAGAGVPDVGDQLGVPRAGPGCTTVRSATLAFLTLATRLDVLGDRRGDVDDVGGVRADGDLLHVEAPPTGRTSAPRSATASTEMALGMPLLISVVPSTGSTAMSQSGPVAVADLFTVVEHRGVVLLALADDHDAAHRHRS